jgi:DNA-binding transcriptional ArsR family regulator
MKQLSGDHIDRIARRAHALADATRVRIVYTLARNELAVGQIAASLDSDPSTISKHLQVLFREGLVTRRREARAVIYSIADAQLLEWCRYFSGRQIGAAARKVS